MPAVDTVAVLNRLGGKSAQGGTNRFTVEVDQMFSPEKHAPSTASRQIQTRRTSGRLQSKRLSQNGPSNGRRGSWTMPDEDESTPAPKPKKKVGLKLSKKDENKSPFKKHGPDLKLPDNPKVNLADSPAKNTRSQNQNPLEQLAKANLPIPESLARENKIGIPESGSKPSSPIASMSTSSSRKRKRDEQLLPKTVEHASETTITRVQAPNETEGQDADTRDSPESVNTGAVEHLTAVPKASRQHKKKPGRPRKPDEDRGSSQARMALEKANREDQLAEARADMQTEFEKNMKHFSKDIESEIKINSCEELWQNLGAAALMIKAHVAEGPLSDRGKAVIRTNAKLMKHYRMLMSDLDPLRKKRSTNAIPAVLEELEGRCNLLRQSDRTAEDRLIVKDMFLKVIPALVVLLKHILRGRSHHRNLFEEETQREIVRVINITIRVCEVARAWQPQPTTLESGIKRWIKDDILANLKRLEAVFSRDLARYERLRAEKKANDELKRRQTAAIEALYEKAETLKLMRTDHLRKMRLQVSQQNSVNARIKVRQEQTILDIDEINDIDINNPFTTAPSNAPVRATKEAQPPNHTTTVVSRPRLVREPTAELPPPVPNNLSEDEKTSLLNGLQRYTEGDRFNDILNDPEFGEILAKRDVDDLMKTARSFSQIMASKMGIDAYRANGTMAWLRSTDPDLR